jgi:branched-chain amino acid transport system ATP-binding protein
VSALDLVDVRAGYGRIQVLHDLTLSVPSGSVVAVLGRNGAGKTTALRTIAGAIRPTDGEIRLHGRRIDGLRPSAIARRGVTLVPEGRGVFPSLSVEDNLRLAHASSDPGVAGAWSEWLGQIGRVFPRLPQRLSQTAGSLSGGEQQMLALARAFVGEPVVVMVDELSMGLAPLVVEELFDTVAALRDRGRTIVLVEQYLTHALRHADICYLLAKGRVAWAGEPGEVRRSATARALLGD